MSLFGNTKVRECIIGNIHTLKQIPGYSAYEIAVKHGFKGTEEEWLASLQGKNGKDGKKGDPGEKGEPGSIELSGEMDAHGLRIMNVADPEDEGDAINKKYFDVEVVQQFQGIYEQIVEEMNAFSAELEAYAEDTLLKKTDQLNANSKVVCNVADPVNGTDAVNKQYADSKFVGNAIENISDDFISRVFDGITVSHKSVFKQGNIISGSVTIRGNLNQTDLINLFQIKSAYKPAASFYCPSKITTYGDSNYGEVVGIYLKEAPTVYVDHMIGSVIASGLDDFNEDFTNELTFGFTYLSK